jgi:hypothetical protein
MMCHCDDFNLVVLDPIDKAKRKIRQEIPACTV